MNFHRLSCFFLFTFLLFACSPAGAISEYELTEHEFLNLSLGLGFEFESGDYGTGSTIDTWRIPLLVAWTPLDRLTLSLEVPYIDQSSTSETVHFGGSTMPRRRMTATGTFPSASGSNSSESGLGDISLDATFTLIQADRQSPFLLALLYSKLPTADEDKGLGTGEFDWGAGLGIGNRLGNWSTYGEILAIQPGTSEVYAPDNYLEWLLSLSYRVKAGLRPGISLSGGTAAFDGADDPLEIKARLSGISGEKSSYSLYLARGLSDASPDWGIGVFGYLDF